MEELTMIPDRDLETLLDHKKLNLVLDLDHTLVHARSIELLTFADKLLINPKSAICISGFAIRLRPGVVSFLKEASTMYDLSIFTVGSRAYAKIMVEILEKRSGVKFKQVLSCEDCLVEKQKTVEVVLSHERVVLIVDDMKDVWKRPYSESNLVTIAQYKFFGTSVVWDDLFGEEAMDAELSRVLSTLTSVHSAFYQYDGAFADEGCGELDYSTRDVREMLKFVRVSEEREKEVTVKNRKRPREEVVYDQRVESCDDAKRYKTCNVVDLTCSAC